MIDHINAYMGLDYDQFTPDSYQPGILLCILSIMLWALCVYKEFRNIWLTFEGLTYLPRTKRTKIQGGKICGRSLSYGNNFVQLSLHILHV